MPITYQIDVPRERVHADFSGRVTRTDLQDYFRRVATEPSYTPRFHRLINWRGMEDISTADVRELAHLIICSARDTVRQGPDRRALVVRPGAQFGIGRMLQIILDVAGCAVDLALFYDEEEAEAWLAGRPDVIPVS